MKRGVQRANPSSSDEQAIGDVARGGALNLVGNGVYGAGQFLLLAVLTSQLGADEAGVVLVAIALFSIVSKICELGASTGVVRALSRDRALGKQHELRANVVVGLTLSFLASSVAAIALLALAPYLAEVFANGSDVERLSDVLRAMSPFLVVASVYTVLAFGSRGFDTMVLQVSVEKVGRALLQPLVVLGVLVAGGGVVAAAAAWAAVQVVTLIAAAIMFRSLLRRAEAETEFAPVPVSPTIARAFLSYSIPRAIGQTFQIAVVWLDSLIIAAVIGTTAAGIYSVGTRYLLLGLFAAEAIMQVIGPRISGLLARRRTDDARLIYATGTAWQTLITWSVYLIVLFFTTPLLKIFGDEYVAAGPALVWLSIAMLLASLCGPSDSVILMSGRSRLSLFNAFVAVSLNVAGNLLLVPRYGITAAGATWAVTLVVGAALPALQAARTLTIHPWSRAVGAAAACATLGVGVPAFVAWLVLGPTAFGLCIALFVGLAALIASIRRFGADVRIDTLLRSIITPRRPASHRGAIGDAGTVS
jgi:O-antigen/teichoic acid export membrane protein